MRDLCHEWIGRVNRLEKEVGMIVRSGGTQVESELGSAPPVSATKKRVFIGHGRSPLWRELKDFVVERLHLEFDEFNRTSVAGKATTERLEEMLNDADFALLLLTAEDDQVNGTKRARENVVHEAGLFQGKLGFRRAILLVEEGCSTFSNVHGLTVIEFPHGHVRSVFEGVRQVLEREGLLHI